MTIRASPWRALRSKVAFRRLNFERTAVTLAFALAATAFGRTEAAGQSFLWKASRGQASIYLAGSVHLLSKDYYPLDPVLEAAFKDSDLLVAEVDIGDMFAAGSQLQLLARGMLPADQSLDEVLASSTFAVVRRRTADLGLPIEAVQRFKPWALALMLLGLEWQKAGFDPNLGLDKHFYDLARNEGKPVQGLETLEFQIAFFDDMTFEEQDRLLASTLKELDTQKAAVTQLADAWKAGDAPTIERIVLQDLREEPRLYQRLLVDRNRDWLPKIDALFARPGRAFVIVGAAHLVGPDGLLAMLRAAGYTVEQM